MKKSPAFLCCLAWVLPSQAAVFTVTSVNDTGAGSLRQAITDANAVAGPDRITFSVGAGGLQTIQPVTALPLIADPITIDATTQPGFAGLPLIELNGQGAPNGSTGLRLATSNSVVRGLVINRWKAHGLAISVGGSNVVESCFIGTDSTGTLDLGNAQDGINLAGGAGTVIGTVGAGNVIGGNNGAGIRAAAVARLSITANRIGTDLTGALSVSNNAAGIEIGGLSNGARIGDPGIGEGNLIAFNGGDGVFLSGGTNLTVRANAIFSNVGLGLDLGSNGVAANDATDNDAGVNQLQNFPVLATASLHSAHTAVLGELRSRSNTVFVVEVFANDAPDASGHGEGQEPLGSFEVTTDATGLAVFNATLPKATTRRFLSATATDPTGNTSEFGPALMAVTTGTAQDFVVTTTTDSGPGSLRQAILDANSALNAGDRITFAIPGPGPHTNAPATALPVILAPVILDGYTQAGAAANTSSTAFTGALQVVLDGSTAPNATDGLVSRAHGATIRGLNFIRWKGDAIELGSSATNAAVSNVVEGCVIGLGLDGTDLGQTANGVFINGGVANRIGGSAPAARNVISGNNRHGVEIGNGPGTRVASGNRVQGNLIGLDSIGTQDRGNSQDGVNLNAAAACLIGGAGDGEGNWISGNDGDGIELGGVPAAGSEVLGNRVGQDVNGAPLRNNQNGILVSNGSRHRIGGTAAGQGNFIRFNGTRGISLSGGTNNAVRGNVIAANANLGLDLGNNGRTVNDPGDVDTGPNQLQNFPELTGGALNPVDTRVAGTLNSRADTTFQIDFFSNGVGDTSGHGEGEAFLGSAPVTTDGSGNATFDVTLPTPGIGRFLTATATDPDGNTSEFAANFRADSTQAPGTFTVTTTADDGPGSLRQALIAADLLPAGAPHRIAFNLAGAGPHFITPSAVLPSPTNEAVFIDGFSQPGSRANTLATGSDADLRVVLDGTDQPAQYGLRLRVPGNTVRGISVVSFRSTGLVLGGGSNVLEGCFIGLLPDGTGKRNDGTGVLLRDDWFGGPGSFDNRIGGTSPDARNVIGGNGDAGIYITGGRNRILGNYLGTDPSGTAARPNRHGVYLTGVEASENQIGGTAAGEGNLISGQSSHGLRVAAGERNLVLGNRIGIDVAGAALPNAGSGVVIGANPGSIVGGTVPGAGNRIAFNGVSGVETESVFGSTNISIRGNAIHDNASLGIDVGGFGLVDFNDVGDTDTGPNNRQNFPVITAATVGAAEVTVAGLLDSRPAVSYALEFFASPVADASGHGEGAQYLGTTTVTTDAGGGATFDVTLPVAAVGLFITATATDATGNTSEFSEAFKAQSAVGGETFVVINTNDSGPGSLRQAILDSNANATSGNRIEFDLPDAEPRVIVPATALPVITAAVTIDGYSQPGARANTLPDRSDALIRVHLDAPAGATFAALTLQDQAITVRGLAITGFSPGIQMNGRNHVVAGCWIGLRPDATSRGNTYGLWLHGATGNLVGGYTPADRNVISANATAGLLIAQGQDGVVAGNLIGTDPAGLEARPNGDYGITAQGTAALTVGGPVAGAGNVIAGHTRAGIHLDGFGGHVIQGNRIGVSVDETTALPNGIGLDCVEVVATLVRANVISGNQSVGIHFAGSRDGHNILEGNFIGTDSTGSRPLGNGLGGVAIGTVQTSFRIGGLAPGNANTIVHNTGPGIQASLGSPVGIRGNHLAANAGLGIDRGAAGVTPNDPGDADDLPNHPELTAATIGPASVQLSGALQARVSENYRLDFYASAEADPSGHGEGAQYLGSSTNTTDATGRAQFSLTFPVLVDGRWITATSMDTSGDSSEFSPAFRADSTLPVGAFTVVNTNDSGPGSLRQALIEAAGVVAGGTHTIVFNLPGTGPRVIEPASPLPPLTGGVVVDGFTQPGTRRHTGDGLLNHELLIQLHGASAGGDAHGLVLSGSGSTVRGLIVTGFGGSGLWITNAPNTTIEECWLGYDGREVAPAGARMLAGPTRWGRFGEDELANQVGISRINTDDLRASGTANTSRITGVLVGSHRRRGIELVGSGSAPGNEGSVVLLDGFQVGSDRSGRPLPSEGPGISIENSHIDRIEILGPGVQALFGNIARSGIVSRITAQKMGIDIFDASRIRVAGTRVGTDGDLALANAWGVRVRNSAVKLEYNNLDGNRWGGLRLGGLSFGSEFRGNRVRGTWNGPAVSVEEDATGVLLGGVEGFQNWLDGRISLATADLVPGNLVYNQFRSEGWPVFQSDADSRLDSPQWTVTGNEVRISDLPASEESGFIHFWLPDADERWLRFVGEHVLPSEVAEVTQPLRNPLEIAWANLDSALQIRKGGQISDFTFASGLSVDSGIKFGAPVPQGRGEDGSHYTLLPVQFYNSGPDPARVRGWIDAPNAEVRPARDLEGPDAMRNSVAFADWPEDPSLGFGGLLGPGQSQTTILRVTSPGNVTVDGWIEAAEDRDSTNSAARRTITVPNAFGLPTDLRLTWKSDFTTSINGGFEVDGEVSNLGASTAIQVRVHLPSHPGLVFVPGTEANTIQSVDTNDNATIRYEPVLRAGGTWNFTARFQAGSSARYLALPALVSSDNQETEASNNAAWLRGEIVDSQQLDWGDAPDTYGTRAPGGANAFVVPGFQFGSRIDAEPDGQPSPRARGDDTDVDGDDEDGVEWLSPLVAGLLATIDVTASAAGYLDFWIDYDGDGRFDHRPLVKTNEYVVDALLHHAHPGQSWRLVPGLNRLRFFVPDRIRAVPSFARFRFSATGGLLPTGAGGSGEVEDYTVQLFDLPPDFGDAPDLHEVPGYPTLLAHNGAVHLTTEENFFLGQRLDFEPDADPDLNAWGDDANDGLEFPLDANPDDEDGVIFMTRLDAGQSATVQVLATIQNSGPGRLDAWVDWNQDLDWADSGEQILTNALVNAGTNLFQLVVPADALEGRTYSRFRLSRQGALAPHGVASSGEVEDHAVLVAAPATCRIAGYQVSGQQMIVTWQGSAVLQQAPTVSGPWTLVPGQSPGSAPVPLNGNAQFFRLRCP